MSPGRTLLMWLRGPDLNRRPSGYEPDELTGCSTQRGCGIVTRHRVEVRAALGGPGGDLLSHVLGRSTIGAEGFHGRVRDGIGCRPLAMATRSSERRPRAGAREQINGSCLCVFGALAAMHGATARRRWSSKPIERLVPVSFTRCRAFTSGLSTWWSSTALEGELVLRRVSRLDAFSGYPVRT
jgi:hypothetical protein